MSETKEFFTSRWGMILSVIGIAVGTGNIWRFSRIVAQNGGGSFLIPWVIFLFIWSIPLIIAEFAIGKSTRMGTVGGIARLAGEKFAWMGAFVGFVATAIMFYYSVVTGWCIKYLVNSLSGTLTTTDDHLALWDSFTSGYEPVMFHAAAIALGGFIIYKGVVRGIERSSRILVPALLLILVTLAVRAVTLPGAWDGIAYLFTPNIETLLDYRVWLAALTQNAWDTGAGWGLILTYACYARKKEDITLNAALTGFGNNSVSLLAGITIFATVFALAPGDGITELISGRGSTNTGLAFIFLPQLFEKMPGGAFVQTFFSIIFFLGLTFAAITSLISMIELAVRVFSDMGLERKRALGLTLALGFLLGIPSAFSLVYFNNQDWVWGIGLMISGGFISFAVIKHGADRFRREAVNSEGTDIHIGRWYNIVVTWLIPLQVIVLIVWWFYLAMTDFDKEGWWNPFHTYSVGTCVLQWGVMMAFFFFMNRVMVRRIFQQAKEPNNAR
ncbi:MAG: sodium-dependent transporter [Ignavibacteriales bacterium]|nr:sodium-dependent transporter [Ignavibacteriales bacterium]